MATEWYYRREGEQNGPISPAQLKQLVASGELGPADLVWREGLSGWAPATKVKGLFADRPRPTPPPSGLSSPTLCFERGNTHLERSEYDRAIAEYTAAIKLDPS